MLRALIKAIYAHVAGSEFLTLLGKPLALHAASSVDLPYAVLTPIAITPGYTFDTVHEHARIQFDVFTENNEAAVTLSESLASLFDDCRLEIEGYRFIGMERMQIRPSSEGVGTHQVNRVSLDYLVKYERKL